MERDVFQAIADPTRREILDLLADREMPVNQVAEKFDMSRPAVSKHLKYLEDSGLLHVRREGRQRFCRTDPGQLAEVMAWVSRYRRFWSGRLDRLEELLAREGDNDEE